MERNKQKVIKCVCFFVCAVTVLSFSGCEQQNTVSERAIVQLIGIDYEDGKYQATLQYFVPQGSGGQQAIDLSKENANTAAGSGNTISEAIEDAMSFQGKTPFYAQNTYVVVGSSIATYDLGLILGYIEFDRDLRANAELIIAENDAKDIVNDNVNEGILPADNLNSISNVLVDAGKLHRVNYFEFATEYYNSFSGILVPVINTEELGESIDAQQTQEEEEQEIRQLKFTGMGIINGVKMVGILPIDDVRGCLWILNKVNATTISDKIEKTEVVSADIMNSNTSIISEWEGDEIQFHIEINNEVRIKEFNSKTVQVLSQEEYDEIDKAIQQVIIDECENTLDTVLYDLKTDVFTFGYHLRQAYPSRENEIEEHWDELIANIDVTIQVNNEFTRMS